MYYPGRTVEAKYKLTQDVLHPTCVLLGKIEGIWEMDEEVTSGVRVSRETVGVEAASRILAASVEQVYADLYCAIYLLPMRHQEAVAGRQVSITEGVRKNLPTLLSLAA